MNEPVAGRESGRGSGRWLRGLQLDVRSLALLRIALGLCVIADLLIRIPQIDDFYSDRGVLPREAIFGSYQGTWAVSLHFISGQWSVQLVLFLVALVFAVGFTLGYRTRLCATVTWVLVMSMQVRNPLVLHAGDDLLRMLLFWSIFVPVGLRWSLDRALNPSAPEPPESHLSPGSVALIFQICAVYWYTFAEKMHPIWFADRTAVYYALSLDQFVTGFGKLLLNYPDLLRVMTTATLVLEALGPLLVLSPFGTGTLRLLAVFLFISFHAGLGLTLHLGLFPWVCVAAWLVFLPPDFWEWVGRRRRRDADITVFFDGHCSFCRRSVLIVQRMLGLEGLEIREAQSDPDIEETMRARNSWIVRERDGELRSGYAALVALCRRAPLGGLPARILNSGPARLVGDWLYRLISADRDRASRALARVTPPAPRAVFHAMTSLVAVVALVLVEATLSRRPTLGIRSLAPLEGRLVTLGQLGQSWRMFSPYPTLDDGWYVMEGITADGRRIDVWNGGGRPDYIKPSDVYPLYRDPRWQKYLTNLWLRSYNNYRVYFGDYLCRRWNEGHTGKDRVELIYVNYMLEWTPEPGKPLPRPQKESILRRTCPGAASSSVAQAP